MQWLNHDHSDFGTPSGVHSDFGTPSAVHSDFGTPYEDRESTVRQIRMREKIIHIRERKRVREREFCEKKIRKIS